MNLDLHVSRFDWAEPAIGAGVARLARTAEATGVRALSFMDHYFQMDMVAPAEDPMLECYTALGFVAGVTQTLRLRVLVTGATYRHPGLLARYYGCGDMMNNHQSVAIAPTRNSGIEHPVDVTLGSCG